ncbi:unnamed protein product [Blumeria hordei]|uniref:Multifunctional tryptophan biosynthesis protein n=2 Tax=Blumeria hordei TaxID=2867405 RepID=A0A383UW36_BLUHO|nr:hypothetical protein BGHDH14_bgh00101 [Blumeria hordei DH14]SZF04563.1 unnamed protein product [Blumeria hordei]
MPAQVIADHSPRVPVAAPPVETASNVILIDNYDSFVWNVYQYLRLEGATVSVFRNDEITVERLITLSPTHLVISPGPGHPQTDSGISREAIAHFAGKIPILGICMGQQCIIDLYGGKVEYAGEVFHGKTSPLQHDGKGAYHGLPQGLPVTRYHSLAGTYQSFPECLEVTSWINTKDGEKGPIMGVRHREYLIEGVQYHPESILTENGNIIIKNFVHFRGGTWLENKRLLSTNVTKENILEKIFAHRKTIVRAQKEIPSQRPSDLQNMLELDIAPPLISFVDRLRTSPFHISLMAEIKRASPSKGNINLDVNVCSQARAYALAGASVISVLTEPKWFKGSIDDLKAIRQALEGMPNRPAILRKEFIFDEYQILEARLAGADSVLLIVKMLEVNTLTRLYLYSQSLGMEPLVEVNTAEEMAIASKLGAKIIGVNNRNLTNFELELNTTTKLLELATDNTIICALSGITGEKDIEAYKGSGISAVLIGEALMRAKSPPSFIRELLGEGKPLPDITVNPLLVKICGTRKAEVAAEAIKAGANMIGIILVPGRNRCVSHEDALAISKVVHESCLPMRNTLIDNSALQASDFFSHASSIIQSNRPSLVGVFQDQPLKDILELQKIYDLDIVQLHGKEPVEWANLIPVPVIRSFKPGQAGISRRGYHSVPLLDSGSGGSGEKLDMSEVKATLSKDKNLRILLAGGLDPENIVEAITQAGEFGDRIIGVDVSSGVEEEGIQSAERIRAFVQAAKSISKR